MAIAGIIEGKEYFAEVIDVSVLQSKLVDEMSEIPDERVVSDTLMQGFFELGKASLQLLH